MGHQDAAAQIRALAGDRPPRVGLILGSGLGGLAESIESFSDVGYSDLPGFPVPTVSGHEGRLRLGTWSGVPVACLQGRFHFYEGHDIQQLAVPIRALRSAGCETLILTCAAGSLQPEMGPGELMLVTDHINWPGISPLVGSNDDTIGPRFVDVSQAYDPTLQKIAQMAANETGITLHEGVYVWCLGPNFETPAEIRAFRKLGADAVGMSTVPECLAAVHCGLRVMAIAVVTNLAAGMQMNLSHVETMTVGSAATPKLSALLGGVMKRLALDY